MLGDKEPNIPLRILALKKIMVWHGRAGGKVSPKKDQSLHFKNSSARS